MTNQYISTHTSTKTYNYHTVTSGHSTELNVLHIVKKYSQNAVRRCNWFCDWCPDGDAIIANAGDGKQQVWEQQPQHERSDSEEITLCLDYHSQLRFRFGALAA